MGFFTDLFKAPDTLPLLTDDEIRMLASFFEKGWAGETRRWGGLPQSGMDAFDDISIAKGVKKRSLTAEDMAKAIKLLETHLRLNGDDPELKEIIRKLRLCRGRMTT